MSDYFWSKRGPAKTNFWTAPEINLARKMRAEGFQYKQIALHLPGRTEKALRRIFAANGWTKDGIRRATGSPVVQPVRRYVRPDDKLIEERDRRANEPRSLSMVMLGDPPFSQSALARPPRGGQSNAEKA